MTEFTQLWPQGPYFAQAGHFKLGTDCVLLSDFVGLSGIKKGIDLGCASGAVFLQLLARSERLHMTGLELLSEAADIARENIEKNSLNDRAEVICGDIRQHRALFQSGSFDLVVANPPYFPVNSGALSPDAGRAGARGELTCTLSELISAAAYLCRTGGTVALVNRTERMAEMMRLMSSMGIEPKRLRLVCPFPASAPNLCLVEGKRGARTGLKVEPILFLNDAEGNPTEEYLRIYHRL